MSDKRWKDWTPWRLKRAQAAEGATADQDSACGGVQSGTTEPQPEAGQRLRIPARKGSRQTPPDSDCYRTAPVIGTTAASTRQGGLKEESDAVL
jgi:hypothetical protein